MELDLHNARHELYRQVQPLFSALGDPTRQAIVFLLTENERLSVQELANTISLSRPAVSHHVKILREAGLVREERDGTKRYYHPVYDRYMQPMRQLINEFEAISKG